MRRRSSQPLSYICALALLACAVLIDAAPAHINVTQPNINVTECLADNCLAQIKACTHDARCDSGIKVRVNCSNACFPTADSRRAPCLPMLSLQCVAKCPTPPTKACVKGCIDAALDGEMLEVGICASAHGCIPLGSVAAAPVEDIKQ